MESVGWFSCVFTSLRVVRSISNCLFNKCSLVHDFALNLLSIILPLV